MSPTCPGPGACLFLENMQSLPPTDRLLRLSYSRQNVFFHIMHKVWVTAKSCIILLSCKAMESFQKTDGGRYAVWAVCHQCTLRTATGSKDAFITNIAHSKCRTSPHRQAGSRTANGERILVLERRANDTANRTHVAVPSPPARNPIPLHKRPQSSQLPKQHSEAAKATAGLSHRAGEQEHRWSIIPDKRCMCHFDKHKVTEIHLRVSDAPLGSDLL